MFINLHYIPDFTTFTITFLGGVLTASTLSLFSLVTFENLGFYSKNGHFSLFLDLISTFHNTPSQFLGILEVSNDIYIVSICPIKCPSDPENHGFDAKYMYIKYNILLF